jgi:TM2 domain-containing membrane protein YozV
MSQPVASYDLLPPPLPGQTPVQPQSQKSFLVTWLLALLLGTFGADRFYLGKIGTAIAKLLTLGGLGVWSLIDLILVLAGVTTDKNGQRLAGYDAKKTVAWIVTAVFIVLGSIGGIAIGISTAAVVTAIPQAVIDDIDEEAGVPVDEPTADAAEPSEGTADPTKPVESDGNESVIAWADDKYGAFDSITQSGSGSMLLQLPAGAESGLVRATYTGTANFSVQPLDGDNKPTVDLLVNSIGDYRGITAYGLLSDPDHPVEWLQVTATGPWTIDVGPVSNAPGPAAVGFGDDVFIYAGTGMDLAVTHDGSENFAIVEYTDDTTARSLLVNDIGVYEGTVPLSDGPMVLTVKADGNWTMAGE